jgi:hypothetical protein
VTTDGKPNKAFWAGLSTEANRPVDDRRWRLKKL